MPQSSVLSAPRYTALLADIRSLIEAGQKAAATAANQILIKTYWQIGKRITEENLTEKAGYSTAVLEDLAEELSLDKSTLVRCVHFFKTYKVAPRGNNLTWTHYRALLPIRNDTQREWYEHEAATQQWTAANLSKAIKENRYSQANLPPNTKSAAPTLPRPTSPSYLYNAVVDRVIDGDTLLLRIDLGFQVWKEQRLRLADLDAPAMDEPGGREAYTYVLHQMAKAACVLVKTHKVDIYGRYVGHVFYAARQMPVDQLFAQGHYLNQELVAKGLAKVM